MASDNREPDPKSITAGLKFNRMQEETTTTIIKQKADPVRQIQIAIGVAIALLAFGIIGYMSFVRSGLDPFKVEPEGHSFGVPTDRKITE